MAIAQVNAIDRASNVVKYNTRLQYKGLIHDIYTMNSGLYNRKNEAWPKNTIKMKVGDDKASQQVITYKQRLRTTGVYGQTAARGTEEGVTTRSLTVYQNNYRKVIPIPGYGLRALEGEMYKLWDKHEQDLVPWNQEQEGYELRMALLERYGVNLTQGDTSALCPQWWNPNMFIPTQSIQNQPAFSTTRQTHTNNICSALQSTGGFGQFLARTLTAPVLDDISNWCLNPLRLSPLKIPGLPTGEGFVLTISELQAGILSNPTIAANNLGSLYIAKAAFPKETVQKWRGLIAGYNNLLIVVDPRIPTVIPSGSAAPYGLTAGYMVWDSIDLRNRNNANVKDVAFIHGENAIVQVEGEKLHWIHDTQDYDFRKGVGTAGCRGYQLPIYQDATTGAIEQFTSAAILLDLPNGGTLGGL